MPVPHTYKITLMTAGTCGDIIISAGLILTREPECTSSPLLTFSCKSRMLTSKPLARTHSRMRKGWLTSVRTSFSLWTCCSCFSRITSGIFICFSAKKDLLFLSLTKKTRPNVPVPVFK